MVKHCEDLVLSTQFKSCVLVKQAHTLLLKIVAINWFIFDGMNELILNSKSNNDMMHKHLNDERS